MITTPDGGRQFWFNPVFYGLPVVEAQLVQVHLDLVHVPVVPGAGYDDATGRTIAERLRDRLPGWRCS
jgi:hypothetical protein